VAHDELSRLGMPRDAQVLAVVARVFDDHPTRDGPKHLGHGWIVATAS
jgi:hypothetical protein